MINHESVRAFLSTLEPNFTDSEKENRGSDLIHHRSRGHKAEKKLIYELSQTKSLLNKEKESNEELYAVVNVLEAKISFLSRENKENSECKMREMQWKNKFESAEDDIKRLRHELRQTQASIMSSSNDMTKRHKVYFDLQEALTSSSNEVLQLRSELERIQRKCQELLNQHASEKSEWEKRYDALQTTFSKTECDLASSKTLISAQQMETMQTGRQAATKLLYVSIRAALVRLLRHSFGQWRTVAAAASVSLYWERKEKSLRASFAEEAEVALADARETMKRELSVQAKVVARLAASRREFADKTLSLTQKRQRAVFSLWKDELLMKRKRDFLATMNALNASSSETQGLREKLRDQAMDMARLEVRTRTQRATCAVRALVLIAATIVRRRLTWAWRVLVLATASSPELVLRALHDRISVLETQSQSLSQDKAHTEEALHAMVRTVSSLQTTVTRRSSLIADLRQAAYRTSLLRNTLASWHTVIVREKAEKARAPRGGGRAGLWGLVLKAKKEGAGGDAPKTAIEPGNIPPSPSPAGGPPVTTATVAATSTAVVAMTSTSNAAEPANTATVNTALSCSSSVTASERHTAISAATAVDEGTVHEEKSKALALTVVSERPQLSRSDSPVRPDSRVALLTSRNLEQHQQPTQSANPPDNALTSAQGPVPQPVSSYRLLGEEVYLVLERAMASLQCDWREASSVRNSSGSAARLSTAGPISADPTDASRDNFHEILVGYGSLAARHLLSEAVRAEQKPAIEWLKLLCAETMAVWDDRRDFHGYLKTKALDRQHRVHRVVSVSNQWTGKQARVGVLWTTGNDADGRLSRSPCLGVGRRAKKAETDVAAAMQDTCVVRAAVLRQVLEGARDEWGSPEEQEQRIWEVASLVRSRNWGRKVDLRRSERQRRAADEAMYLCLLRALLYSNDR